MKKVMKTLGTMPKNCDVFFITKEKFENIKEDMSMNSVIDNSLALVSIKDILKSKKYANIERIKVIKLDKTLFKKYNVLFAIVKDELRCTSAIYELYGEMAPRKTK